MKKIYFLVIFFMILTSGYTQVKLNVWDKSKANLKVARSLHSKTNNLPKSFESTLPTGEVVIYERFNRPSIKVNTSSGRSSTVEPIVYKSDTKGNWSIVVLTERGWIGNSTTKNSSYVMNYSKVEKLVDTIGMPDNFCQISKEVGTEKLVNNLEIAASPNSNYYDSLYVVKKTCSLYVEADYKTYQFFENNLQSTIDYINLHYQIVSYLFAREGVRFNLYETFIWDTQDPYTPYTGFILGISGIWLDQFRVRPLQTNCFFRQLIGAQGRGGGVADYASDANGYECYLPRLKQYSAIELTQNPDIPPGDLNLRNMGINVLACVHELGHNLGSEHTHRCNFWKNRNGLSLERIDSCYTSSISCPNTEPLRRDSLVPSIMSYCHLKDYHTLNQSIVNGFKTLPRWAIKATLENSIQIFNDTVPTVTTDVISNIKSNSAVLSGQVLSNGGYGIIERGFVWSTNPDPNVISGNKFIIFGDVGSFSDTLDNLITSQTYYIRAFATNIYGTSYGVKRSFLTSNNILPIVRTLPLTFPEAPFYEVCADWKTLNLFYQSGPNNVNLSCATSGVEVISQGSSRVNRYGLMWSKNPNFSRTVQGSWEGIIENSTPNTSDGVGTYVFNFGNLTPDTIYYLKAFARNTSMGTAYTYGETIAVRTPKIQPNIITLNPILVNNLYTLQGKIIHPGQRAVEVTKLELSKKISSVSLGVDNNPSNFNPTLVGQGVYQTPNLTLDTNQLYEVRFKASNSAYSSVGNKVSFYTGITPKAPILKNIKVEGITDQSARVSAKIYSAGSSLINVTTLPDGQIVTDVKLFYKKSTESTYQSLQAEFFTGDSIFCDLGGLSSTTQYVGYFSASNLDGEGRTTSFNFTTQSALPVVSNLSFSDLTKTSVVLSASLEYVGGSWFPEKGFVLSTTPQPTFDDLTDLRVYDNGSDINFSQLVLDLIPGTLYYVRAFARNDLGVAYSYEISFTTVSNIPIVYTQNILLSPTNFDKVKFRANASVDTGSVINSRGFVWSTNPNPTIGNNPSVYAGAGGGYFESEFITLNLLQTYYVRAYVYVDTNLTYGNEVQFNIPQPSGSNPTVTTISINSISQTTISVLGNVLSDGGITIDERGVIYSKTPNVGLPYVGGPDVTKVLHPSTGIGEFTTQVGNLEIGETYYIRTYAKNQFYVGYGEELTWKINEITEPIIITKPITNLTTNSANSGGTIISDGGLPILEMGLVYSGSPDPSIGNGDKIVSNSMNIGGFTTELTELLPNVLYFAKAYLINNSGTYYGNQVQFETFSTIDTLDCVLNGIQSFINPNNTWTIRFPINANCSSYDVTLSIYNLTNPKIAPTDNTKPTMNSVKLKNYAPMKNDLMNGYVDCIISVPPTKGDLGRWNGVSIKCNGCVGPNITKHYFYIAPP